MKTTLIAAALAVTAISTAAAPLSDATLKRALPVCAGKFEQKRTPMPQKLPAGLTGEWIILDSEDYGCAGQYAAITAANGDYYIGMPFFIDPFAGTPEEKIKAFGWERLQGTYNAKVGTERSPYGLLKTLVTEKTEYGDSVIEGWTDKEGTVFFPGNFVAKSEDPAKARVAVLKRFQESAPTEGPRDATVWITEFSDFQCPSCRNGASKMEPILEKYKGKVRYTRIDFPLMSIHPWAFPAAVAGRAIHHQNPDAFWKYKKTIYDQQPELSVFMLEGVAHDFAAGSGLDEKKYEADVNGKEIRSEILAGIAAGYGIPVMSTPTYLVNGVMVSPGVDFSALDRYIAGELGAK